MPYYKSWVSTHRAARRFRVGRAGGFGPKVEDFRRTNPLVCWGGIVATRRITTYSFRIQTFLRTDDYPVIPVDNCVEKLFITNNNAKQNQVLIPLSYSLWITDNVN